MVKWWWRWEWDDAEGHAGEWGGYYFISGLGWAPMVLGGRVRRRCQNNGRWPLNNGRCPLHGCPGITEPRPTNVPKGKWIFLRLAVKLEAALSVDFATYHGLLGVIDIPVGETSCRSPGFTNGWHRHLLVNRMLFDVKGAPGLFFLSNIRSWIYI